MGFSAESLLRFLCFGVQLKMVEKNFLTTMDQNNNWTPGTGKQCVCPHHEVIPFLVIIFAVVFLLGTLGYVSSETVAIVWPILVGIAGITKLTERACKCC